MEGSLELIIGNMFSGKSSELIRRINREKSINKKILVINYALDTRYSIDSVSTHDQVQVKCMHVNVLAEIDLDIIKNVDSIFIDEGQFFSDLFTSVLCFVDVYKKHVVVSGLDGDSSRNIFGELIKLIPICDTVDKLRAYCNKCNDGTYAPFTKKLVCSKGVIDIGGSDKYIPVCRSHYFN